MVKETRRERGTGHRDPTLTGETFPEMGRTAEVCKAKWVLVQVFFSNFVKASKAACPGIAGTPFQGDLPDAGRSSQITAALGTLRMDAGRSLQRTARPGLPRQLRSGHWESQRGPISSSRGISKFAQQQ